MKDSFFKNTALISLILLIISLIYFFIGINFDLNHAIFDEELVLYGAERVSHGDVPYRDFWTIYAPGQFYILALLFKIFGTHILIERWFSIVCQSLIVLTVYTIVRRATKQQFALFASFLALVWMQYGFYYGYPVVTAVLFALWSYIAITNFVKTLKIKWIVIAGLLSGIAGFFRQDVGFYAFLSMVAAYYILSLISRRAAFSEKKCFFSIFKFSALYISTFLLMVLALYFYPFFNSGFGEMWGDLVVIPATVYPKVRLLKSPPTWQNPALFKVPLLIMCLSVIVFLWQFRKGRLSFEKTFSILATILLGISFLNCVSIRKDIPHLFSAMLVTIILFAYLLNEVKNIFIFRKSYWLIIFIQILVVCFVMPFFARNLYTRLKISLLPDKVISRSKLILARTKGCFDFNPLTLAQQDAVRFIQENTKAEEKIFVGNWRHDRIFINDISFYFFSERESATKYHELHPGIATEKSVQDYIVSEIKSHNVKFVILCLIFEGVVEPNESSISSGVYILDYFIRKNYAVVRQFGPYLILLKNSPRFI